MVMKANRKSKHFKKPSATQGKTFPCAHPCQLQILQACYTATSVHFSKIYAMALCLYWFPPVHHCLLSFLH